MPEADAQRLDALNRFMQTELGSDFYIAPLERVDSQVEPSDRWKNHYNQKPLDCISRKMILHVNGSDF
jgi:hypothetical protein